MENAELILGIRNGSEKHFKALFDEHHTRVYSLARRIGLSHEAGQDIVQEAFVSLWNQRASLREDLSIHGLLQTITKRILHKRIRRLLLESDYLTYLQKTAHAEDRVADPDLAHHEINHVLQTALHLLPERRKEVFLLNYQQDLTAEEIALALNISTRTAENQLYRARKFLRAYFGRHGFSMEETAPYYGGLLVLLVLRQNW